MISNEIRKLNGLRLDRMGDVSDHKRYIVYQYVYGQKLALFSNDDKVICDRYITEYKETCADWTFEIKDTKTI